MANYFEVHKNKKPKKAKYSKPYTKLQYNKMQLLVDFFTKESKKIRKKIDKIK